MKISIITTTYNSAATVHDTLQSVAAQSYPDVEHIVVDGVSRDNTLEIVGQYPHVCKIISEHDQGLYDAMNKGIGLATGDVIAFLNSDDFYIHPEVLSQVAAHLQETQADALYADLEYVDRCHTDRVVRYWKSGSYQSLRFLKGWMPPHPAFFARRSVFERLGGFDTRFRYSADYELMLRFLFRHRISVCYLPKTLVRMRTGGISNASLLHRWQANREDLMAWHTNGLRPRFYTLWLKPLSKISQYRIWNGQNYFFIS